MMLGSLCRLGLGGPDLDVLPAMSRLLCFGTFPGLCALYECGKGTARERKLAV